MPSLHQAEHACDVCVVGGGMAGMCAAIAAARRGAKTILIHDRPVLGGNASSEVRMWVCGAHGRHNKETGVLEEIQLANLARNVDLNYSVWDSVLWEAVTFQPGLTTLLNASVTEAGFEATAGQARRSNDSTDPLTAAHGEPRDDGRITSVKAWQLTTQTWHTVHATQFIDCSGDSILGALVPAEQRRGRERRAEFGEPIAPPEPDRKTMGNTLLIQLRRVGRPVPYIPPRWAYRFTSPDDLPFRVKGVRCQNFWWLELGGLDDTIRDGEAIRDELMRAAYGVWDFVKNHAPEKDQAEDWALEWVGSLPGKRENRRLVGDHMLTQHDVEAEGRFDDTVAYGGWTMDDHHPAGLLYPGKPTHHYDAPSPYGIPYRSLYSRNIGNLIMAGRNISTTHAALSSTRVMATCAVIGQAAGTAAALCIKHGCGPRALSSGDRLRELQQALMDDDCFLPGFRRAASPLTDDAALVTDGELNLATLTDGIDRDREDEPHGVDLPLGRPVELRWAGPRTIGGLRLTLDSNLNDDKRMPCSYPQKARGPRVPASLVRAFRVEARDASGHWSTVARSEENHERLVRLPLGVETDAVRFVPEQTWGADVARVFAIDAVERFDVRGSDVPDGEPWRAVVERVDPADLADPDIGERVGKSADAPRAPSGGASA